MKIAKLSDMRKSFSKIIKARQLYLMLLLPLIYVIIFNYLPMLGIVIAFKNYNANLGIFKSPWVGIHNFRRFFESYAFKKVISNTVILSIYNVLASFPVPIILAIGINHMRNEKFKKTVQMVTYAPYFISVVVMVGLISQFFNTRYGIVNQIITSLGGETVNFMGSPGWFRSMYVWSGVWRKAGYDSIIYIATLASIDPQLHEAAIIDGASIWKRIWYIDIQGVKQTIVVLLILRMGQMLSVGFDKVFLMQNPLNLRTSEVIATYVYKVGLSSGMPNFSFGTAINLFQSVIGLILLITVNKISKKIMSASLW